MGQVSCIFAGGGVVNRIAALGMLLCVSSTARGAVLATVFLADGETPLESADPNVPFFYRDIMVGTKLTIVVSSDTAESWDGQLRITGTDRAYGSVSARDFNDVTPTRKGSIFEAAGELAAVEPFENSDQAGVTLSAGRSVMAGDWFIFDYTATNVGNCRVDFYELIVPPGADFDPDNPRDPEEVLLHEMVFSHVPTRDFNSDTKVDFIDFAIMAAFNGITNCAHLNGCEGTDLDLDGDVDCDDLMLFAEYWLERTQ
ncbi:MAG: hypothetical protein ACYSWQ_26505 [Planctomycetota bacterium]|jgi:hypothetical protein